MVSVEFMHENKLLIGWIVCIVSNFINNIHIMLVAENKINTSDVQL